MISAGAMLNPSLTAEQLIGLERADHQRRMQELSAFTEQALARMDAEPSAERRIEIATWASQRVVEIAFL